MYVTLHAIMANQTTTTGQTNAPVFAYDRGWNDPPKRVFAPVATNRKRIDPRKRVGHDLTSSQSQPQPQPYAHQAPPGPHHQHQQQPGSHYHQPPGSGYSTPPYMPPGPTPPQHNANIGQQTGYSTPPLLGGNNGPLLGSSGVMGSGVQHASSSPDIHRAVSEPLPPMVQSNSMPYNFYPNGPQVAQPPPATFLPVSPPKSLETVTPPPFSPPLALNQVQPAPAAPQSLTPPTQRGDTRKLSSPTSRPGNDSIFNRMGTPTMLHSTHLSQTPQAAPETNTETVPPPSAAAPAGILQPVAPVPNVMLPPPIATFGNSANNTPQQIVAENPSALSQPPPPQQMLQCNTFAPPQQLQNAPPQQQNLLQCNTFAAPPQQPMSAPPTNGFYRSPAGSGPNSPVPPKKGGDQEMSTDDIAVLDGVVEKLLNCLNKCSCVITNKNSDDISKKIQLFKTAGSSGKLSPAVREQMGVLSASLDRGEVGPADAVHKALVVSHSGEVMSWMIGIKKLISVYQKVLDAASN